MHGEFLESFPDYTIFNCKFKTDECFYSLNVFSLQIGEILKIVKRQSTLRL